MQSIVHNFDDLIALQDLRQMEMKLAALLLDAALLCEAKNGRPNLPDVRCGRRLEKIPRFW